MVKKTIKLKYSITVKSYEDIPGSLIGNNLILYWSKGTRSRDKGSISAVFCKESSVQVNEKISFKTKLVYDESKDVFEKKPFKFKLKCGITSSKSTKPRIVGKEKIDLSKFCNLKADTVQEFDTTLDLVSKKYDPSKLVITITSCVDHGSKESTSSNEIDSTLDDTSTSELTEFNEISSEEDSLADSLNSTNYEQPKRRKKVRRSVTIGEHQYLNVTSDDGMVRSSSHYDDSKLNKKAEDIKKRLEKYKNEIIELKQKNQELEESKKVLIKGYETEKLKLVERVTELEQSLKNNQSSTGTNVTSSTSILKKFTTKVTTEDKMIVMVILIIFLTLCVIDQFQKLIYGI